LPGDRIELRLRWVDDRVFSVQLPRRIRPAPRVQALSRACAEYWPPTVVVAPCVIATIKKGVNKTDNCSEYY